MKRVGSASVESQESHARSCGWAAAHEAIVAVFHTRRARHHCQAIVRTVQARAQVGPRHERATSGWNRQFRSCDDVARTPLQRTPISGPR